MKKTLLPLLILFTVIATSFADETISPKNILVPADGRFRAHEWQVDTAVVGNAGVYKGEGKQGLGADLGFNYFFLKYIGVGIDNSVSGAHNAGLTGSTGLEAVYGLKGYLLLRYPIESWNLAPYAMIGGGGHWGITSQGDGNVGGGLEYRLTPKVGLFTDCLWLYGTGLSMARARAGLRFIF